MEDFGDVGQAPQQPAEMVTVAADCTITAAANLLRKRGIGCLVVTDGRDKAVGVLTERDIVGQVAAGHVDAKSTPVREIMNPHIVSCPPGTTMRDAKEIMAAHHIRHLPIVADGVAVGMISSRDLLTRELHNDKAMKAAAERIAMLSTGLKSLDFDEVVDMVTREVPSIFNARTCVLCFPEDDDPQASPLLVNRYQCPCEEGKLRFRQDVKQAFRGKDVSCGDVPAVCAKHGAKAPAVVIALSVAGLAPSGGSAAKKESRGYLCMCGLRQPAAEPEELVRYKASLVRGLLNVNLANASMYHVAKHNSMTDPLTGIGSRRLFEERIEAECVRANRYRKPFAVAIADLDRFKSINDKLGHKVGDEALVRLGECMAHEKRASDILARYGGDEFILLMPETELHGALVLIERIRKRVAEAEMPEGVRLSFSCGVVQRGAGSHLSGNELVRRADMAMYHAKKTGRNRTATWREVAGGLKETELAETEKVKKLQERVASLSIRSKEMFVQSIYGLVQALEARDRFTKSHSENVMRYAVGIAETMDVDAEDVAIIRRAAMIHDIGKIGVPDAILRKPGQLTAGERAVMEQHCLIGVGILDQMRFLERELPIVRYHHERWDGAGYPDGIAGTAIPLGARLLAVADSFDAITSDRVYQRSRPLPEAMEVLAEHRGTQFDPDVVDAMTAWVNQVAGRLERPETVTPRDLLESQKSVVFAA